MFLTLLYANLTSYANLTIHKETLIKDIDYVANLVSTFNYEENNNTYNDLFSFDHWGYHVDDPRLKQNNSFIQKFYKNVLGATVQENILCPREFKRYIDGLIQFHEYFKESVKKDYKNLTKIIPENDSLCFSFLNLENSSIQHIGFQYTYFNILNNLIQYHPVGLMDTYRWLRLNEIGHAVSAPFNTINLQEKTYIFSSWMHEIAHYISEIQLGPTYYYYRKEIKKNIAAHAKSFALIQDIYNLDTNFFPKDITINKQKLSKNRMMFELFYSNHHNFFEYQMLIINNEFFYQGGVALDVENFGHSLLELFNNILKKTTADNTLQFLKTFINPNNIILFEYIVNILNDSNNYYLKHLHNFFTNLNFIDGIALLKKSKELLNNLTNETKTFLINNIKDHLNNLKKELLKDSNPDQDLVYLNSYQNFLEKYKNAFNDIKDLENLPWLVSKDKEKISKFNKELANLDIPYPTRGDIFNLDLFLYFLISD